LIQKKGHVTDLEMQRTFNMGVGLVLICPKEQVEPVIRLFDRHEYRAFELGHVQKKRGVWIEGKQIV
jgi:phosphoribosylformylglycinamidine cyclo-ligase